MAHANSAHAKHVFISHASTNRERVEGLKLLLDAMGHEVFFAPLSIRLGTVWKQKLLEGLEKADVLLVFWTKQADRSDWVRTEYETFIARYPDRLLIPILGDETELPELLRTRQASSDFASLINELLQMQRDLKKHGIAAEIIQEKILERLKDAGIDIDPEDRRRVFAFAGASWLAGFSMAHATSSTLHTVLEAIATLTLPQAAVLGSAVVAGWLACGVLGSDEEAQPSDAAPPGQQVAPGRGGNIAREFTEECTGRGPHQGIGGVCCGTSIQISQCGFGFARDWDCTTGLKDGSPEYRAYICGQLREKGGICPEVAEFCLDRPVQPIPP